MPVLPVCLGSANSVVPNGLPMSPNVFRQQQAGALVMKVSLEHFT